MRAGGFFCFYLFLVPLLPPLAYVLYASRMLWCCIFFLFNLFYLLPIKKGHEDFMGPELWVLTALQQLVLGKFRVLFVIRFKFRTFCLFMRSYFLAFTPIKKKKRKNLPSIHLDQ